VLGSLDASFEFVEPQADVPELDGGSVLEASAAPGSAPRLLDCGMRAGAAVLVGAALVLALPACRAKEPPPDPKQLIADLRGPDPEKSGRARLLLITLGDPVVPDLAEMLRSGSAAERVLAANTLWGMGDRARAAVPDLTLALSDPDPGLQRAAAMALENMGPAAEAAVPALAKALGDHDAGVRQAAVKALGAIGPGAKAALPALTRALRRGTWPEAQEAVRRIRGLEPGAPIELGPEEPGEP
jgi:HEAT repeat protein